MNFFTYLTALLFTAGISASAVAQGLLEKAAEIRQASVVSQPQMGLVRVGQVQAELVAEPASIRPGERFFAALRLVHDPHWHTYWRNPGDSGLATRVDWQLPDGWAAGELQWPTPKRLPVGPLASFGFEDEVLLIAELRAPKTLTADSTVELSARVNWLMCKDVCIPGQAFLGMRLPVLGAGQDPPPLSPHAKAFANARAALAVAEPHRKISAYVEGRKLVLAWPEHGLTYPGFFFPYQEGLIAPPAAQTLSQTEAGFRLDLDLSESPDQALAAIRRMGTLSGIWVPAGQPGLEWTASWGSGSPPAVLRVLDPGRTAQAESSSTPAGGFGAGGWSAFLFALVGAFLGGVILNAMPCVFPVIGLKVLSFANSAHSRSASLRHALIFSAGVIATFLLLAALLIGLRAAGEAVGWGFQLQNPWVVLSLALLFVAISANLAGFFETGLVLSRLGNVNLATQEDSGLSTFGSGVLAVVVASPCTAPFMGSAVGFTATASVAQTLAVFAMLGVGMSLPYLVLSLWPGLLARLPRPGPWMVRFKQAMAFPMLAAAAWLVWVLAMLQGADSVLGALMASIALAFALWVYGRYVQLGQASLAAITVMVAALVLAAWAAWMVARAQPPKASDQASQTISTDTSAATSAVNSAPGVWQPWSAGRPEQAQASGSTVFVDFTASWCISCQANKVRVLDSRAVRQAFEQQQVVMLRADWTRQDATIARELARHGRAGVPLYLVYHKNGGAPKILSEWLTEQEVLDAIR